MARFIFLAMLLGVRAFAAEASGDLGHTLTDWANQIQWRIERVLFRMEPSHALPEGYVFSIQNQVGPAPFISDGCFREKFPSQCYQTTGAVEWLNANSWIRRTQDRRVQYKGDRWWQKVQRVRLKTEKPACASAREHFDEHLRARADHPVFLADRLLYKEAKKCIDLRLGWIGVSDWIAVDPRALSLKRRLQEWGKDIYGSSADTGAPLEIDADFASTGSVRAEVATALVGQCLVPPRYLIEGDRALSKSSRQVRSWNGFDRYFLPGWKSAQKRPLEPDYVRYLATLGWNSREAAMRVAGFSEEDLRSLQAVAATLVGEVEGCALDLERQTLVPGHLEMVGRVVLDRVQHRRRELERGQSSTRFGRRDELGRDLSLWEQVVSKNRHFSVWNSDHDNWVLLRALCPITSRNVSHWDANSLSKMGYGRSVHLVSELYDRLWRQAIGLALELIDDPADFRRQNPWISSVEKPRRARRKRDDSRWEPNYSRNIYYYTHGVDLASDDTEVKTFWIDPENVSRQISAKSKTRLAPFVQLHDVVGISQWVFEYRRSPACRPARFWKANW